MIRFLHLTLSIKEKKLGQGSQQAAETNIFLTEKKWKTQIYSVGYVMLASRKLFS